MHPTLAALPTVSASTVAHLALVAGLLAVVALLERRVAGTQPVDLPTWVQVLLGGLAVGGPWLLYSQGLLDTPLVDGSVLWLFLAMALWFTVWYATGLGRSGETC